MHPYHHPVIGYREDLERLGVEGRGDEHVLSGGLVRHVDEAVLHAARDAHHVSRLCVEAAPIRLVEIASLDDAEDLRLVVAMPGWALARRVEGLDQAEFTGARRGRHAGRAPRP